jgi:hypothetical protein
MPNLGGQLFDIEKVTGTYRADLIAGSTSPLTSIAWARE